MGNQKMNKGFFLLLMVVVVLAGCDKEARVVQQQAPEPWCSSPPEKWPQIVMTNSTEFKGHTPLRGASSFLIRTESGNVLAATARHLLGENGGVEPALPVAELDSKLGFWHMHPRTLPKQRVRIAGSATRADSGKSNDWLLLKLVEGEVPAVAPLKIRPEPVKVGDQVFLIGVSYAEPDATQKVYSGRVTERGFGDRFRYTITPHVDISGFSGAPIVDEKGLLVGVMTVWFRPKMNGELFTEAGGEDARSALSVMKTP
jgi:hypothetical protein